MNIQENYVIDKVILFMNIKYWDNVLVVPTKLREPYFKGVYDDNDQHIGLLIIDI